MPFNSSAAVAVAPSPASVSPPMPKPGTLRHPVQHEPGTLVFVSPRAFRRVWFTLVLAHALCAAFVTSVGVVYVYLRRYYVIESFVLYGVVVEAKYLSQIAAMYFVLAGIHLWLLGGILARSYRSRTYSLRRASIVARLNPSRRLVQVRTLAYTRVALQLARLVDAALTRCPSIVSTVLRSAWRFLGACRAAMDVRHPNYGLVFLVRELVQSSLQTYQAYRLSCLVPRVWTNNVIVALLVFNCWSTSLIQSIFPANLAKVRLGCALVSVSLDFVSYAVIPVAIFLPYLLEFDFTKGDFGLEYWYTDAWLTQTINELQLLFVTSFGDAVSKFMMATSVARWLFAITKLVKVAPVSPAVAIRQVHSTASVEPNAPPARSRAPLHTAAWKNRLERDGKRVLILWGWVVLAAHVRAAWLPVYPQCQLRTRPWFGSKPSCSLLAYDCWLEQSAGSERDLDQFLQLFDEARIGFLSIRRCPLLEMPPRLKTLSALRGLKLYQSSILKWDLEEALTNSHHPEMLLVFLGDVNMTELPQGLLSTDFPKKLLDIEMYGSNVSRLPDNLASIWPSDMFLILENCQFQQVPSAVLSLKASFLSLALNNFSSVPTKLLAPVTPAYLYLDGNPIQSLPGNLTSVSVLEAVWISFRETQVASLPDWIDERYLTGAVVLAGGTPLCDRMVKLGLASETANLAQMGLAGLDCSLYPDESGERPLGWYPIGNEELNNPTYTF